MGIKLFITFAYYFNVYRICGIAIFLFSHIGNLYLLSFLISLAKGLFYQFIDCLKVLILLYFSLGFYFIDFHFDLSHSCLSAYFDFICPFSSFLQWKIEIIDLRPFFSSHRVSSIQFSHSVTYDPLRPHGLHHGRPPCPLPTPGVYSDSCPLSR